jgi:hypothetical protein
MASETYLSALWALLSACQSLYLACEVIEGRGGAAALYEELAFVAVPLLVDLAPGQGKAAMGTCRSLLIGHDIASCTEL